MKHTVKKYSSILLLVALLFSFSVMFTACSGGTSSGKPTIVCTIFPIYDWTREILGEAVEEYELVMLFENGADLHNYQPTVADIASVSTASLFLYVGGESDAWVDGISNSGKEGMRTLALLDLVSGIEHDHEHHEGEESCEEPSHNHGKEDHEYDEHVWLSLRNATRCVEAISEALASIDPERESVFRANAAAYTEKLEALDARYVQTVADAKRTTLLFADRFPFAYLAEDYGLTYYAAFSGCSAETEASFETITSLSGKINELSLPAVLVIESSDGSIARTVIENAGAKNVKILTMHSCQSVTSKLLSEGISYLSVMEDNLTVLREALN